MRHIVPALFLAFVLACNSARSQPSPETPTAPAAAVSEGSTAPSATTEAPAAENAPEAAPGADSGAAGAEEAEKPQGLLDKALGILKSTEAIVAALISILTLLGIGAGVIKRLKQTREALNTVTHKIEEHKSKHEVATVNLKKSIDKVAPKESAVGSIIHASAKVAEMRVNGAKGA